MTEYTVEIRNRFWSKVKLPDVIGGPDCCWEWTATTRDGRYGTFSITHTKFVMAHRFAYELCIGPIPNKMIVCHSCDNTFCCNPAHLWIGTNAENSADMIAKGRQAKGAKQGRHIHPELNKLTADMVVEIRNRYANGGITQGQLAKEYGVGRDQISRIVNRNRWAHIP